MRYHRGLIVALIAIVAGVTAAGAWMRVRNNTHELAGDWKSWRTELHISHADKGYTIAVTNPDGFLGGSYTGTLRGTALKVDGPMSALCGQMAYSIDDDKLEFCGEQFARITN